VESKLKESLAEQEAQVTTEFGVLEQDRVVMTEKNLIKVR
jgi:hypothetical protein